jgi:site-specific DNA recombinase
METKKNVGIWIRVSTDMQVKDESPEHHERRARLYAEAKGWTVVTVYRLEAMSGKSVMDYSETKRMLQDMREGLITGLIFSKLARLARNTKELLEISEIFRNNNADLISLAESIDTSTPAGRLFYTMIAAMAQWEREEISERVAASVPIRAKMGKSLGGQASFGYKWEGNELLINEVEAPVRKLLYELFIKTKRKKTTATQLNNLGYRTRNGSPFTDTTISRLLRDPTAKGVRRANYTKSLGEGKKWTIKPKQEWVEIPCPALVAESVWDECNIILDQQEKKRNPRGPKTNYLLTGFVHCDCGSKMYVFTESPVYKCKTCKRKIRVDDLDEIFHEQLKTFLLTDADLETVSLKSQTAISEKEALLKTISGEHTKLKKKMEELVNLRIGGEISKIDFSGMYKPIEEQVRQLEYQLPELEAEIDFLKIQALSTDTIHQEAKDLYNRWMQLPFEEKRAIIETITNKIVIEPDTIDISLSYQPTTQPANNTISQNAGKSQRNFSPANGHCKTRHLPNSIGTIPLHLRRRQLDG